MNGLGLGLKLWPGAGGRGGGGGAPGSPYYHYDFSDDANMTLVGSAIDAIADLGSAGVTLSAIDSTWRPVNTGTMNGRQAATFAAGDALVGTLDSGDSFKGAWEDKPLTLAWSGKFSVNTSNQSVAGWSRATGLTAFLVAGMGNSVTKWHYRHRADSSVIATAGSAVNTDTNVHTVIFSTTGTAVTCTVDGTDVFTGESLDHTATTLERFMIGALIWNGTSIFNDFSGEVGEVLVYDSELTGTDRTALVDYLGDRWL